MHRVYQLKHSWGIARRTQPRGADIAQPVLPHPWMEYCAMRQARTSRPALRHPWMEYHERRPTHALAGPAAKYARLRPERRLRKSHCIVRDSTRTTPSQVGSQHAPVPLNPHVHHASRHARLCLIRSHTVQRRRSIRDGPPRAKLPGLTPSAFFRPLHLALLAETGTIACKRAWRPLGGTTCDTF